MALAKQPEKVMSYPIAFHGLVAYSGKKSVVGLYKAARECERGVHFCVSDKAIGPVGIAIQGEMTDLFYEDCWSVLGEDGKRRATREWVQKMTAPTTHDEWVAASETPVDWCYTRYMEGWMYGHLIRAVWVKAWANAHYQEAARKVAKALGVDLIVIEDGKKFIPSHFPADSDESARFDTFSYLEDAA